ncbi:MAG TPA: SRPBCC domain-containing protein [Streptosporangiaceae bacterium]|nr:SRPBCC domain-containing protein [Streptosporangiaceae bacterium]
MELEHSFTVPVPKERAWDVLLDVERVAPCMPGATLDSVDGDEIKGRIKVKVGPISMTYTGTAKIVERDEKAGIVRLDASGKETRGAGTASASVRSVLEDQGQQTYVTVLTTLNVTGKPAQFGRGVMNEVSGKLLNIFATNLAAMLAQPDDTGTQAHSAAATDAAPVADAAPGGAVAGGTGAATLDDLKLPARAIASLNRDGIATVSQLAAKSEAELLAIDGIGPASVEDIKARLGAQGLTLGHAAEGAGPGTDQPADVLAGLAAAPAPAPAPASAPAAAGAGIQDGTDARTEAGAAANGAHRSRSAAAATNGSRTGATASGTSKRAAPHTAAQTEADSINLIKVAGMPVLKRSFPVIAGVSVVLFLGLRRRMRRRHR